jgi:hypothetical protein
MCKLQSADCRCFSLYWIFKYFVKNIIVKIFNVKVAVEIIKLYKISRCRVALKLQLYFLSSNFGVRPVFLYWCRGLIFGVTCRAILHCFRASWVCLYSYYTCNNIQWGFLCIYLYKYISMYIRVCIYVNVLILALLTVFHVLISMLWCYPIRGSFVYSYIWKLMYYIGKFERLSYCINVIGLFLVGRSPYASDRDVSGESAFFKSKSKSHCDWRSVSRYVLVSSPNLGHLTRVFFSKLLSCFFGAPSLTRGRFCHVSVSVIEVYHSLVYLQ